MADQRVEHVALPGASEARLEVCLDRPRRWHGRRDPHVYRASVTLLEGDTVLDAVEQPLGVRAVAIDRQRGFLLNGEPYDLRGVNLHQDLEGRGWAMSRADRERDFQLMLDMGRTFVRLAHYQHDADVYELADRLGLVVWTEHAFVNRAGRSPRFAERCSLHLRELIRQNFNHPSVAFWGIGNEVQTHEGPARTILEQLAREVRLEDPSRLSTLATNYAEPVGAYGLDSIAHNQYHGWYHSTPEAFAGWIDQQRAKTPGESLGMSEYGAGAGVSIHRAAPARMDHSEEYQAYFHEIYWRTLRERPWVWCKAVWVMFDFASAGRDEGEAPGINDKGLVSRDRQVRKDAYFWYQANWTDKPMVHITGCRFNPRTTEMVEVKAYSNCTSAELRLNGEGIGTVAVNDAMARWPAVKLRAGRNVVEVTARRGDSLVSDRCEWTLTPAP